jgi:pyridoxine 4-dehydrogenase
VHDNLRNLGLEVLDMVNLRIMFDVHGPAEGRSKRRSRHWRSCSGKAWSSHIGLSNVTPGQVAEGRRSAHRLRAEPVQPRPSQRRRADRRPGPRRHSLCSVLPARRLQSAAVLSAFRVAATLGATPMQVALAWLLRRSSNILLIPGTSSVAHLRENLAAGKLELPADAVEALDRVAAPVAE